MRVTPLLLKERDVPELATRDIARLGLAETATHETLRCLLEVESHLVVHLALYRAAAKDGAKPCADRRCHS